MSNKNFYCYLPAIVLSTLLTVVFVSAWTEPSGAPPIVNVSAPVNIGTTTQVKVGSLVIGGAAFETYYRTILATLGDNVGIGTSTPAYKLDIYGVANASQLCIAGDCRSVWPSGGGGNWILASSTLYPSDTSWNVGIGTTSAEGRVDIYGANDRLLKLKRAGTPSNFSFDLGGDGKLVLKDQFNNARLTFDTAGNTGIWTTNPNYKLDIEGDIRGSLNGIFGGSLSVRNATVTGGDIIKWANDKFIHTTGPASTYMGWNAGNGTTTGWSNSGFGYNALVSITSGGYNTAMGDSALFYTTTGGFNTALGYYSMQANNTGIYNTAVGDESLQWNTTGNWNTTFGAQSLLDNTVANGNTALGFMTGRKPSGSLLLTSGSYNLFVGYKAGPSTSTLRNATAIGANAQVAQSNTMILGSTGADIVNVGIGATTSNERLEVNGGVRLNTTAAKPACSATKRGTVWVTQGAAGVKDTMELCAKDAANVYAWRVLY